MNCWDFIKCPQEYREYCLAYPNYGKICWKATLVSCKTGKILDSGKKLEECLQCEFYKMYYVENKID
ncbi:MAG TPA: hypothetical protein VGB01_05155 [candidate division Zixibacteria bacterium]|jgi:hypothetical protein